MDTVCLARISEMPILSSRSTLTSFHSLRERHKAVRRCSNFILSLSLTLKFSKRQKSACARAADEPVEPESSSSVCHNRLFHLGGQGAKPSRQRDTTAYYWKTLERQLQGSIRAIYEINFAMFVSPYTCVACRCGIQRDLRCSNS